MWKWKVGLVVVCILAVLWVASEAMGYKEVSHGASNALMVILFWYPIPHNVLKDWKLLVTAILFTAGTVISYIPLYETLGEIIAFIGLFLRMGVVVRWIFYESHKREKA